MELIQRQFNNKLKEVTFMNNRRYLSKKKYFKLIRKYKIIKSCRKRSAADKWFMKHYAITRRKGMDKLIHPDKTNGMKYYVCNEDLCQTLFETHRRIGHSDLNKMFHELKKNYVNIRKEQIAWFLECCETCKQKIDCREKITGNLTMFEYFNKRGRFHLIDFRLQIRSMHKYILVYQDISTKFILLQAIISNLAKEVSYILFTNFAIFGPPCVIESAQNRQYHIELITNLKSYWPQLNIVCGKIKYAQNEKTMDDISIDIQKRLCSWMTENKTTNWNNYLPMVQFLLNKSNNCMNNKIPYVAMFGREVEVGIQSSQLPEPILNSLYLEEDLETIAQYKFQVDDSDTEENSVHNIYFSCILCRKHFRMHTEIIADEYLCQDCEINDCNIPPTERENESPDNQSSDSVICID
ncbi:PREDICTED: KRAB-A domain-containing protein 2-like [Polistes dominula]|uniref:KRAB-A domain-containing protein 2-like n=1 Tax=Polistes dominula TaxID=743375 RepID=A0ABM1J4A6_POLDO|nr:PREDICTED: KRAB-A domain-containing protein 2-like [Polistes dominula]